jgi:hypothetical protein
MRTKKSARAQALKTISAAANVLKRMAAAPELRQDVTFQAMVAELDALREKWTDRFEAQEC